MTSVLPDDPQTMDEQVTLRIHAAPGMFAGDVFDETRLVPINLVDFIAQPFAKSFFQPLVLLSVPFEIAPGEPAESAVFV